jgi:FtsP/CotA-like multicopper oxidase with cupredoxin domain
VFEVMNPNTKVNGAAVIQPADYPLFQNPTLANKPQRDALIAKCKVDLQGPFIWWDTLAINQGLTDSTRALVLNSAGECALPGYFKMRSRFVDFPGKFVLHCHILGHEDRGMMQLVEVSTRHTAAKHH